MALVEAAGGRTLKAVADSRALQRAKESTRRDDDIQLSPEEQERAGIVKYCRTLIQTARKARKPHDTFELAWALFTGDVWSPRRPPWRAAITINKIRAIIFFIQSIMTDQKPRVSVEPLIPGSEEAADLLRKLSDRDWDENDMQLVCAIWALYGLIFGSSFLKVYYDPYANGGRGKHCADVVPAYKIFINPTAKGIEDAQYLIHVDEVPMGWVREHFPKQAKACERVKGFRSTGTTEEIRDRDLVREGNSHAPRILSAMEVNRNIVLPGAPMSHPNYQDDDHETVEISEIWLRDQTLEEYHYPVVENGRMVMKPEIEDGVVVMESVGTRIIQSEIDGALIEVPERKPKMVPKMQSGWRKKFPNGRLIIIAGGQILLRDIPNPYQTDGFPWAMWKDQDVGSVYAQGEPLQLRSCATAVNKIVSQVYEILQKTGNPGWKVKKGANVNVNAITNQPGQMIPMDDTQTGMVPLEKPSVPSEFFTLYEIITKGIGEMSGVTDAVTGGMNTANTAFATVDQLQESSSAPIRQKVRNFESGLKRYGKLRIQLIQQYDQGDRPLRIEPQYPSDVVQPAADVAVQFRHYTNTDLQGEVEFSVQPISSLSVSPTGSFNRWLKLKEIGAVDNLWLHKFLKLEGYRTEVPRMMAQQEVNMAKDAAAKKASKVGGTATKDASKSSAQSRRPPPASVPR